MAKASVRNVTLNPAGVATPMHRVAALVSQAVGTCLRALDRDECTEPEAWGAPFGYQFTGMTLDADERREAFRNWVLSKGFQDLARGVRETLEEAFVYASLAESFIGVRVKVKDFRDAERGFRERGSKLQFRALSSEVNSRLTEPMAFEDEFRSLQNVRNCLEHRGGRVGSRDVDVDTGGLTLTFPRLKIFLLKNGEEKEVPIGQTIDARLADPDPSDGSIPIYMKRESRRRVYALNEPVIIEFSEFYEIVMACRMFSDDLVRKLPGARVEDTA